ncbi:MAG: hypothetical protein ACK5RV_01575 [Flavobacterium sp.]|jgi:hypothetical protein|uniref:hypothetical protein n=1 Tax=Flavobacterium sp. TaxID=239 RepID=UPI0022BD8555|nr:hypothetical protein [Flavobacterium sp.]MCZ8169516.1 hypothetical protein [Flavobacterium sp.]
MSFIYNYYFAQTYSTKPPSQWETGDVQRFEKILKLETTFHGVELQRNSKEHFLTALKEKSELLRFMDNFPEFAQLFRSKTDLLKEYPEAWDYDDFDFAQLTFEVENCLSEDWTNFIIEKLAQNQVYYLIFMMRFEALMPESVRNVLRNKLEAILIAYRDNVHFESLTNDWYSYKSYVEFTLLLKDSYLHHIIVAIEEKREQRMKEIFDAIQSKNSGTVQNPMMSILMLVSVFLLILLISRSLLR